MHLLIVFDTRYEDQKVKRQVISTIFVLNEMPHNQWGIPMGLRPSMHLWGIPMRHRWSIGYGYAPLDMGHSQKHFTNHFPL
ncbi:unnamed protein product [Pieris macdunnoughi]|uniref:Uncharacterized protein n=1 Tax=Pieris macdunnoughi TaxID=345717 RepID=A0A821N072_9NEOP|nr:unnamed protein product [Pieris macdunnoughi]